MRPLKLLLFCTVLALLLTPLTTFGAKSVAAEDFCFPETRYCAANAFLDYWRAHGAIDILGLPVSQPLVDDRDLIVQYYERAILEWHPDNPPEYQVLLTRLGASQLGDRPERREPPQPCAPPACASLAETGHTLRGAFLDYWQAYGGLAVFGFPLTEEFKEVNQADGKEYLVQYFERNRFEYHPEHAGSKYVVSLGLLGAEALQAQPGLLDRPLATVPDYNYRAADPTRLAIPAIGVDAPAIPVGQDAGGNMGAPDSAHEVAWYRPGPEPGERGNAVIAGHVDFAGVGRAIFWDVRRLAPGDEVWITSADGTRRRFLVQRVETYLASQAPLGEIFGETQEVNLNLISCIGNFDPTTSSYDRRTVVYTRWDGISR